MDARSPGALAGDAPVKYFEPCSSRLWFREPTCGHGPLHVRFSPAIIADMQ
jgi:hypothetical protein